MIFITKISLLFWSIMLFIRLSMFHIAVNWFQQMFIMLFARPGCTEKESCVSSTKQ